MIGLLAGVAAVFVVVGVTLVVAGWRRRQRPTARLSRTPASPWQRWWRRLRPVQRRLLLIGVVAGVVVLAVTGWLPALVVVPLVVAGVPAALGAPKNRDIEVLEALDRWVRALIASLMTGKSVTDAIRSTRRQAPDALVDAVLLSAARLDERWSLPEALVGFTDDVDHADADAVAAALIVAGQRGTAAAATLAALADSLQDRLSAAREIDNERAKPRIVVRQVSLVTGVVLGLALVTSPAYFAPFRSGLGAVFATGLALVYVGALAKLRSASRPTPRARLRLGFGGQP